MFAPPLYVVRKFPLSFIISNNFNIQLDPDEEKRFQVKQGDNMLFRQVRLITYETDKFNRFVVFVNCVGGQNKKKEMTRLIHHGFKVGKQEFVVSERSASMVRQGILSFVDRRIARELDKRITMGITFDKCVISKFSGYRGLCFSSCHCIEGWVPNIVVIPDCFLTIKDQHIKYVYDKKIKFKDLGLLVVDEEQRFGVGHKETLKEMSKNVDVLTLSATPIPRTLNMALSGIRDMSSIEEPPQNRHPVQTFVLEQNDGVLLDAIRRELGRGGQVYYLHNRVESIERCANMWQQRLPDARIGIVHGKMGQKEIAKVMNEMADGEIDILVCTTIIETGIDIPNANTLIIENADNMGLAQLHQIRGRVGRSSRHAYAYLCYRHGKALSEIAQKRLGAIREFAAFGSGFKIAMRDLEIRGAGNVLGPEQSGHMMSVGYDLYLKLLEEAVQEEKGETPKPRVDCAAELLISANLPADYVADAGQRVDLYRRIALIRTDEQHSDMLDELIDRFGEPPAEAIALLDIALLRAKASEQGIAEIKQQDGRLLLTFSETDFARLSALCGDSEFKGRLLLNAGSTPYLSLRLNKGETAMKMVQTLVDKYAATAK